MLLGVQKKAKQGQKQRLRCLCSLEAILLVIAELMIQLALSPSKTPPQQWCSPRGWYSPVPWLGRRRAPVSRTCHARTNTHTRASCCCCCCCYGVVAVLLRSVLVLLLLLLPVNSRVLSPHHSQRNNERKKYDKKEKDGTLVFMDTKKESSARIMAGKTKQRKKEEKKKRGKNLPKKGTSQEAKRAKNFRRVPQQRIFSSAITVWEGLKCGRLCRACPPKWARSKYVYKLPWYDCTLYLHDTRCSHLLLKYFEVLLYNVYYKVKKRLLWDRGFRRNSYLHMLRIPTAVETKTGL